ncbi:unnamed protein product [Caenorhabditis sp. 36 PRJEB53466]|nr:unnamed protein product [Caenorhabditis sp. 36 PRJEB53466]
MRRVDFSAAKWLLVHYYLLGSMALILNSFAVYLLIFHCSKLGRFRYYLLSLQILCCLTDICEDFLVQPQALFPITAGYASGLLSSFFGFSTLFCVGVMLEVVVVQIEILVFCFLMKHQSIAKILDVHVLSKRNKYFLASIFITTPFTVGVALKFGTMSKEQQWTYIRENYPDYISSFQELANFEICQKSIEFLCLIALVMFAALMVITSLFLLTFDMFHMMNVLKTKLSPTAYHRHQHAVKSLLVQLTTSLFCTLPPSLFGVTIFLDFPSVQLVAELCLAWFSTHSSVSVICLIIFFPPFNTFIVRLFRRFESRKVKEDTGGVA